MPKSRRYNWPELLAEFEQSGLSQVAFCSTKEIDPKYFNQQLNKYRRKKSERFSEVQIKSEYSQAGGLVLQVGQCKVLCPETMAIPSLVSLVHALS